MGSRSTSRCKTQYLYMHMYLYTRLYRMDYIAYVYIDSTPVAPFRRSVQPIVLTWSPHRSQDAKHIICICICICICLCIWWTIVRTYILTTRRSRSLGGVFRRLFRRGVIIEAKIQNTLYIYVYVYAYTCVSNTVYNVRMHWQHTGLPL